MWMVEGSQKAHEWQVLQSLHSENVDLAQVNDVENVLGFLPNYFQL